MRRDRLTVVLGAGASAAAGAPTVRELSRVILDMRTPRIIADHPEYLTSIESVGSPRLEDLGKAPSVSTIELIKRGLQLGENRLDFEVVLHSIEMLETYAATRSYSAETLNVRPIIAGFTDPMPRFQQLFNYSALVATRWAVIHLIRSTIVDSLAKPPPDVMTASQAFVNELRLAFDLDVQNLNYDTLWDDLADWVDGFRSKGAGLSIFDRGMFVRALESESNLMCHTHGSILYGYPEPKSSSAVAEPRALVKYTNAEEASQSLQYFRKPHYIDSVLDEESPIISGAHKVHKLSSAPYSYYYESFQRAIQRNSRLLFIGYSFSDPHFNRWAFELIRIHGNDAKIAIIDKKPERGVDWSLASNQTLCDVRQQLQDGSGDLMRDARELATSGRLAISGFGYPLRSDLTKKLIGWLKS